MAVEKQNTKLDRNSYWQGLIKEWEGSGQSQALFCRERKIAHSNFFNWRKRLSATRIKPNTSLFTPVTVTPAQIIQSKQTSKSGVALVLKNDVRLEITADSDKDALKMVLDALGLLVC